MEQHGGSVPTHDQIKHWPELEERPPTPASVWLFSEMPFSLQSRVGVPWAGRTPATAQILQLYPFLSHL